MTEQSFKKLDELYKCKDCGYWYGDYDCGHTDENSGICGDFYLNEDNDHSKNQEG